VLGLRHYDSFYLYDRGVTGITSRSAKIL
jgi:hypothetical protein